MDTSKSKKHAIDLTGKARNGRPGTLAGVTKKLLTGHDPLYVTMNDDEFRPRGCFVLLGCPGAYDIPRRRARRLPEEIVKQLRGIQDGHPAGVGPNAVLSVPDSVAKALSENYFRAWADSPEELPIPIVGACPDCGGELSHLKGCG